MIKFTNTNPEPHAPNELLTVCDFIEDFTLLTNSLVTAPPLISMNGIGVSYSNLESRSNSTGYVDIIFDLYFT